MSIALRIARRAESAAFGAVSWAKLMPTVRQKVGARLGVYVAYYDAAEIFPAHLNALSQRAAGKFNYYVMGNCTSRAGVAEFEHAATGMPYARVFRPWPRLLPYSHGVSIQRMFDRTSDEIVVVCDVDAFPVVDGWDEIILNELRTKQAIGVLAHLPRRTELKTFLHPCFIAFRRSLIAANGISLLADGDNDPCCAITRYLESVGQFNPDCVTALTPSRHEVQIWPGRAHDPIFGSENLLHGFGTTYSDFVFHLWFWRFVARRKPVPGDDGNIILSVENMNEVMARILSGRK